MLLYVYKIIRLIIIAGIITYFIGCGWWMLCIQSYKLDRDYNFISFNGLGNPLAEHDWDEEEEERLGWRTQLIVSCYYALTTLSTVGYGDYFPISSLERIIAVIIMLGGVAFFSYIIGNFIEIISNTKMGTSDRSADLNNWLIQLQRYNKD